MIEPRPPLNPRRSPGWRLFKLITDVLAGVAFLATVALFFKWLIGVLS